MNHLSFYLLSIIISVWPKESLAQTKAWDAQYYNCDSLHLSHGKTDTFNIYLNTAADQGVYIDTIYDQQRIPVFLKIINNYETKVITDSPLSKNSRMTWYKLDNKRTLHPGEFSMVKSQWYIPGPYPGKLNCPYRIKYSYKDSTYYKTIQFWGTSLYTKHYRDSLKKAHDQRMLEAAKKKESSELSSSIIKVEKSVPAKSTSIKKEPKEPEELLGYPSFEFYPVSGPSNAQTKQYLSYQFRNDSIISRAVIRQEFKEQYGNDTFKIESGIFRHDTLWNGFRLKPYRKWTPSDTFLVRNGVECGFILNNEAVNLIDSIGAQGKWIRIHPRAGKIGRIEYFRDGIYIDSLISFYPTGELLSRNHFHLSSDSDTSKIEFYKSGKIKSVSIADGFSYYYTKTRQHYYYQKKYSCSDSYFKNYMYKLGIYEKPKPRVLAFEDEDGNIHEGYVYDGDDLHENSRGRDYVGKVIEDYKNGKLVSRTYPSKCRFVVDRIEGQHGAKDCEYIKETGSFVDEKLYNGHIWIFDNSHKLIKRIPVVDGKF